MYELISSYDHLEYDYAYGEALANGTVYLTTNRYIPNWGNDGIDETIHEYFRCMGMGKECYFVTNPTLGYNTPISLISKDDNSETWYYVLTSFAREEFCYIDDHGDAHLTSDFFETAVITDIYGNEVSGLTIDLEQLYFTGLWK